MDRATWWAVGTALVLLTSACGDAGGASGILGRASRANTEASRQTAQTQIEQLSSAVRMFRLKTRNLPKSLDDLLGAYLEADAVPLDPWGNPYVYTRVDAKTFDLRSYGPDGAEGGEGPDADIVPRPR